MDVQPIRTTLRLVVVGYRVVGAVWLASLAAVTLAEGVPRPGVVLTATGGALGWAALTVTLSLRRPGSLHHWAWTSADVLVAALIVLAPRLAQTQAGFFGGYPMSAVFLAAYAHGYPGGILSASALAVAGVARWGGAGALPAADLASQVFIYLATGAVSPWAIRVLVRSEDLRLRAEADLERERAERVRAQERTELASHLHDSVLQTLALIQRRAHRPDEVASLARRQERDLRDWLLGVEQEGTGDRLAETLRRTCRDIEDLYDIRVDLVAVGDCRLTEGLSALVAAGREALTNAAKFSGADHVAVYLEVEDDEVTLFVRDRGIGFEPEKVPADRRGVADSIVGRTERHGGRADVRSASGQGTEVEIRMPRSRP